MDSPVERTIEELLAEAEGVNDGTVSVGQFITSLDWSLPRISQRGGTYAPQSVGIIAELLDRIGLEARELGPDAYRALAAAAAVAAREGDDPSSVERVHGLLVTARLLPPGPPPEPRPRSVIHHRAPDRPTSQVESEPETRLDPALDPEVERLARRLAPGRTAMQPLRLMGLGWTVALSLVLGLLAGIWLDGQLDSSPMFTIVGLLLGLLGSYTAVRELIRQSRAG